MTYLSEVNGRLDGTGLLLLVGGADADLALGFLGLVRLKERQKLGQLAHDGLQGRFALHGAELVRVQPLGGLLLLVRLDALDLFRRRAQPLLDDFGRARLAAAAAAALFAAGLVVALACSARGDGRLLLGVVLVNYALIPRRARRAPCARARARSGRLRLFL